MSNTSTVFNGKEFADSLNLILAKTILPTSPLVAASPQAQTYMAGAGSDTFFNGITRSNAPFTDWNGFVASWSSFAGGAAGTTLENAFLADFKAAIGYPGQFPASLNITNSDVLTWMKNFMSHFLANYPYSNGAVGNTAAFFSTLAKEIAVAANLQTIGTVSVGTTNSIVSVANYRVVYETFFPQQFGETTTDVDARFAAELKSFIDKVVADNGNGNPANGWFVSSQSFHDWFKLELDKFNASQNRSAVELRSTVDTTGSATSLLVISRVLALLTKMVSILQEISANQAQYLSFITNWQTAYTTYLTQVPQFSAGDRTPLGGSTTNRTIDKRAAAFRNKDTNPKMQNILQQVQARQANVQDTAKSRQTSINQSQDAANQLTQMLTSLLQSLNTILSSIYR